jgi:hypothetical protein
MRTTSGIIRGGAFLLWLGGLYVTYLLVSDYTAGAGNLLIGLCILAVAASAFGLILARHFFNLGQNFSGLIGAAMWAGGLIVLGMFEIGYWNETFNARANEVAINSSTYTGKREMVEEAQAKLKLPEYRNVKEPSETEQEIKNKLGSYLKDYHATLASLTKDCTKPLSDVADKCEEVGKLKLELERGNAKKRYEETLKTASTFIKTRQLLDTMGAANWAKERWGGDIEAWRDRVMIVFLLLLVICRDGMLYLVFSPTEREGVLAPKVAKAEPEVAQFLKAGPIPQISAPIAQETPQEDAPSKTQEAPQEGIQDVAPDRAKKATSKQVKKAAKASPGKVIPFGEVSGKTIKSAALEAVVVRRCKVIKPGEYPVDALFKRIAPHAQDEGLNPSKRHIGAALRELGYERKKRGTKIFYVIDGGSKQAAFGA